MKLTTTLPNGGKLSCVVQLSQHGNQVPYFSVTGDLYGPTGRHEACGMLHDEILAAWPHLANAIALHLSDIDGLPMHAEANGWYWLAGAVDGHFGQEIHGGNGTPARTQDECLEIFAKHVRTTIGDARRLRDWFASMHVALARTTFKHWVAEQRPRWQDDAKRVIDQLKLQTEYA